MSEPKRDDSCGNVYAIARQRLFWRWGVRLSLLAAVAGIAFGGWRGYHAVRNDHLAREARRFYKANDHRSASLVIRQLLNLDPDNIEATRLMAEMAEAHRNADAVHWRRRLLHLEPERDENRFALIAAGLRFGQGSLARRILQEVPAEKRNTAQYHRLAGALALTERNLPSAAKSFQEAVRLEPKNVDARLELATLKVTSPDFELIEEARQTLRELAAEEVARTRALRALAREALGRRSIYDAVAWARQLVEQADATIGDKLLLLDAASTTAEADETLRDVQQSVVSSSEDAAQLIVWLNRRGRADEALDFAQTLGADVATKQPLPLAVAESYSMRQDWQALVRFLTDRTWGPSEALRLAVLSHALHRIGGDDQAEMEVKATWRTALALAEKVPAQVMMLGELAHGWGYIDQAEQAWWTAANSAAHVRDALGALQKLYKRTENSRGLYRVAKRAYEINPDDLIAANNVASLGLLLGEAAAARRLALKLHTEHPKNVPFATTYAFALFDEGKIADALRVMEQIQPAQLRHPPTAAYYVIMLVEAGDLERAREFLPVANGAELLPEERALLKSASQKISAESAPEVAQNAVRS